MWVARLRVENQGIMVIQSSHFNAYPDKRMAHVSIDWYDKVDPFEIQEMAGYTQVSCDAIQDLIDRLVKTAKDHSIPLGAVQAIIGRLWRIAA